MVSRGRIMLSGIKAWIYGAVLAAFAAVAGRLYLKGRSDQKTDTMEDDYENAEDIRRRVSVNRADKLRELDDAGWRSDE